MIAKVEINSLDNLDKITKRVIDSEHGIILLDGCVGNGKSTVAQRKIHEYLKNNPKKVAIMLKSNAHGLYLDRYVDVVERICNDSVYRINYLEDRVEYKNGSYFWIKNPKHFNEFGYFWDIIFLEDADQLDEDIYARALRRGKMILACDVPMMDDPTQHWIYKRLIKTNLADRYNWGYDDLPIGHFETYVGNLRNLNEKQRMRLYEGTWQEYKPEEKPMHQSRVVIRTPYLPNRIELRNPKYDWED